MELCKVNSVSQQHVVEVRVNSIGELKQAVANFMYSEDEEIISTKKKHAHL